MSSLNKLMFYFLLLTLRAAECENFGYTLHFPIYIVSHLLQSIMDNSIQTTTNMKIRKPVFLFNVLFYTHFKRKFIENKIIKIKRRCRTYILSIYLKSRERN